MSHLVNNDVESDPVFPAQSKPYSKSFLKLILFGFSLVGLPLIGALINSAMSIDNLAELSRKTVYQATEITHENRVLVDEIVVMERSVRQALILGDLSLLEGYFQAHDEFDAATVKLFDLSSRVEQQLVLEKLRLLELSIYRQVLELNDGSEQLNNFVNDFAVLLDAANVFSNIGHNFIDLDVKHMLSLAEQARTSVQWQLLALIPFVILLAIVFSFFITRPIRQIDNAIYSLGQGELSKPIHVKGPQNLKYLGDRLDWMRRRLLELEEQKIEFFRHVSHELKTPLTAILEGADLLAEGVTGKLTDKQQQIANILHSSSIQLHKHIENLLSFSALQTDRSALVKHQVDISNILDIVLESQNLSIMSKSLRIEKNCPALLLECDKEKAKIMIDNLLSNAIKFSPQGGCIRFNAVQTDHSIQLDVIDDGVGIFEADQERIFEPFYQGRSIPDSPIKGTGLGLSIAQGYALAHGGNIESLERSNGAHFRLTLPTHDVERIV
ncbi:MAG: ATP-binding protein [Nitrosomonas sp.]|nr:ATP-binding protein [Nitrosomonas sp.]